MGQVEISMYAFARMFSLAVKSLRRHKLRSALTCVGIVIGVGAVVAITEIGQGSSQQMQRAIASVGAGVIQIDPSDAVNAGASSGGGGKVTLTPRDCEAILRECGAVQWAVPSVDCRVQITFGNRNWSPSNVLGTAPEFLAIRNWSPPAEGEMFTDDDVRNQAAVCLVGQTVVRNLFGGQSPLGQMIRVKGIGMRVIGVLRPKGANMLGRDQDDYVIAPWTTVKYRLAGRQAAAAGGGRTSGGVRTLKDPYPSAALTLYPQPSAIQMADSPTMVRFEDLDDIWVSASTPAETPQAIAQIRALLRERHKLAEGDPDDFRIRDLTEINETVASTGKTVAALVLCVAAISLVVGGVGIMNIMLISVRERTREIGVRMAVGARAKDILRQFLIEAVILCSLGGLMGIAVGHLASMFVTWMWNWPTVVSFQAMAAAFGISAVVGIIFGYYPAWSASRLDPIAALRYE